MNVVQDNERRERYHPEVGGIVLAANTAGVGPFPIINTVLSDPIPVVSVSVDTFRMRDPKVLLIFTSQINLPLGISVTLNFTVRRSCGHGSPQFVGGTYTFSTLVTALEAEAFSFQLIDNNPCEGNVTYSVELSTNSIIDIVPGLTITNATLSALAVDEH